MRSKTQREVQQDDKTDKSKPVKIVLALMQCEGSGHEFTVFFEVSVEGYVATTSTDGHRASTGNTLSRAKRLVRLWRIDSRARSSQRHVNPLKIKRERAAVRHWNHSRRPVQCSQKAHRSQEQTEKFRVEIDWPGLHSHRIPPRGFRHWCHPSKSVSNETVNRTIFRNCYSKYSFFSIVILTFLNDINKNYFLT